MGEGAGRGAALRDGGLRVSPALTPALTPVFAALGDDTRWSILARVGE